MVERICIYAAMLINFAVTAYFAVTIKEDGRWQTIITIGGGVMAALYGALQNVRLTEGQNKHLEECHKTQKLVEVSNTKADTAAVKADSAARLAAMATRVAEDTNSVVKKLAADSDCKDDENTPKRI